MMLLEKVYFLAILKGTVCSVDLDVCCFSISVTQNQTVPGQGFGGDVDTNVLESEIGESTLFQSQFLSKFK